MRYSKLLLTLCVLLQILERGTTAAKCYQDVVDMGTLN